MAKVLLVDDEELVLRCIKRLLTGIHECVVASDPRRALEMIAGGESFDVVFCDLRLRDMTGCEFAEALRTTPAGRHQSLVMISGDHLGLQECSEKCGRLVLAKPFSIEELTAMIEQAMAAEDRGCEPCHRRRSSVETAGT